MSSRSRRGAGGSGLGAGEFSSTFGLTWPVLSRRAERVLLFVPALALLAVVAGRAWRVETALAAQVAGSAKPQSPAPSLEPLRVCADPNNLPFSNARGEGFENGLAELVAREMGRGGGVKYTWWAQRRGFVRNTLAAGRCDVVMGVPAHYDPTLTTRPYYRSSYVFVTRHAAGREHARQLRELRTQAFDAPALRTLRVGVQLVGDDYVNTPPAEALARRGIVRNVRGYTVYGDYREEAPPARIVEAVARGDVDVAVVWGPLAGYFAPRQRVPLDVTPVAVDAEPPALRFAFDIAMGVRRGDTALRDTLDRILTRRRADVSRILDRYGVPRADPSLRETANAR